MKTRPRLGAVSRVAAGLALLSCAALAGSITYDFSADPVLDPDIQLYSDIVSETGYPNWLETGGNPGGFLVLSYAGTYQQTHIIFPDLDPGKVVTAFTFECDLRLGNGTAQPADGFSINFARSYDPVIEQWGTNPGRGYAGDVLSGWSAGATETIPETGTSTGIAICFDTWSGNTLPDGSDLVGIMVRVDNKTIPGPSNARGFPMPTFNGACTDATSAQTGPRDTEFWNAAGSIYGPEAWDTLCWAHLKVQLDSAGRLTVEWKGNKLLDNYQTAYFPTPGRLVFGGRTGGSHEQTHVDNIVLTTAAEVLDTDPPTVPGNLRTTLVGARRVSLQWDPSVDVPNAGARVAYNVYRDGTLIKGAVTDTTYTDAPGPDGTAASQLVPGSAHSYTVKAIDLGQNESAAATLPVTLAAEVPVPGYFSGQVYTDVTGTVLEDWWTVDPNFPDKPGKQAWWLTGLSFGNQTAFGNTLGENYGFRFTGTLTAPKTGDYRFFVRSDDSSTFYINPAGPAIPNVYAVSADASETDCCDSFVEPGVANDDGSTFATSEPVSLTGGQKYGFVWLVKEGGGGDWGQVAWRMEGDTTPASGLPAIGGAFVTPGTGSAVSDAGGASVTITQDLADVVQGANEHMTLAVVATTVSPWGYPAAFQWFKDGSPIYNANAATYYVDVLSASDAGKYKVLVSVPGAFAYSKEITVTVNADTTKPTIVDGSAHGSADFLSASLSFSEPVTDPSATSPGSYAISGGVTVSAVTRLSLYSVRLTTSLQAGGTEYTITVNGVKDNAGNTIAPNSTTVFKSFVAPPLGYANFEQWQYGAAPTLDNFLNEKIGYGAAPTDPSAATSSSLVQGFETGTAWDFGANYGGRLMGYFIPQASGNYVFFCTSDDSSYLFLSTDDKPANKKRIGQETAWSNSRQWLASGGGSDLTAKRSDQYANTDWAGGVGAAISLTANNKYYIEGIWQEGGGGDGFGATFKLTTEADSVVNDNSGASRITGNLLQGIMPVDPWIGTPVIDTQPVSVAADKGATVVFSVVVGNGARPLKYQWQRGWADLAGETGPTLTIANVDASKVGDYKVVVSNAAGSATSRPAILTLKTMFLIEAEDFDYDSGQHKAVADTMPYTGMAYDGLSAKFNVDYHNDNNDSITYRRGGDIAVSGQGVSMDNSTGNSLSLDRGAWTVVNNYKIGWIGTGDWHNYTRAIPAGTYTAYAALSYDGSSASQLKAKLSKVTAGVGTATQTLLDYGVFDQEGSRGWGRNNLVPMKDAGGAMAVFNIADPVTTLRMSHDSGDFDWFMLIPTEAAPEQPVASIKINADGTITVSWTGGGTLQAATSLFGPWQNVSSTSPYTFTPQAGVPMMFGRIVK